MEKSRERSLDVLRGVGIILVVLGHSASKGVLLHDSIFLFHIPLFFLISGVLLQPEDDVICFAQIKNRVMRLTIPYLVYLVLDCVALRRKCSISMVAHLLWGGRFLEGVYWYITAFLFALMRFALIRKYIPERLQKLVILAGGGNSSY